METNESRFNITIHFVGTCNLLEFENVSPHNTYYLKKCFFEETHCIQWLGMSINLSNVTYIEYFEIKEDNNDNN